MPLEVRRGEMYFADLSPTKGSEQDGYRPVLVVQNDRGNRYSPTVVVAAITGKPKKTNLPTHYMLPAFRGLTIPSVVLCEQIRTIDKSRLQTYIGTLDEITMRGIDRSIAVSMGIDK
jgi:mRNA interferase MazF